jgi:hypothetical protein
LREQGGEVIISFGGATGFPLAFVADNVNQLRDAYKAVIDAYQLQFIDFDIEGMFVAHPGSIEMRSKAMKLLQDEYPDLKISLTLPVMPWGLTSDGINIVKSALNHGVEPEVVNLMTMDYGGSGDMGDNAISALNATFTQLKNIFEENGSPLADSVIWRKLGATPMIGQNDVAGEIFNLDDAMDLRDFVFDKKIGRLSMWSANRDKQCENEWDALYLCSHIEQEPFEFSFIFQKDGTVNYCDVSTGISAYNKESPEIYVYPNPSKDFVFIRGVIKSRITIFDNAGKILSCENVENNDAVDITSLHKGLFVIKIETNEATVFKKMIKY